MGIIHHEGNSDFTSENGVTGGIGNSINPFIISGWEISTIRVSDTTAHFIILDCYITSSSEYAIEFENVKNGDIQNCIGDEYGVGVEFEDTTDSTIENTSSDRIMLRNSSYNVIKDCTNTKGIALVDSSNANIIQDCEISSNSYYIGIRIGGHMDRDCNSNLIRDCEISGCKYGIQIGEVTLMCYNTKIYNCDISKCERGILLYYGVTLNGMTEKVRVTTGMTTQAQILMAME